MLEIMMFAAMEHYNMKFRILTLKCVKEYVVFANRFGGYANKTMKTLGKIRTNTGPAF